VENYKIDDQIINPNPSNNMIFVIKSNINIKKIDVYTLDGLLLYSGTEDSIDVGEFPSGIYIVRIETEEQIFSKNLSIVR